MVAPAAPLRLRHYIGLGLVSAAVLAFQILLLRVFQFSQWHHFASLVVSLALLGFGVAGTVLVVLGERAVRWGDALAALASLLAAAGMLAVFVLNQTLTVRPLFAIWDSRELLRLLVLDFAAFIPFFAGGIVIGQVFVRWPVATRRLYAANLFGSGVGSLGSTLLLMQFSVELSIFFIILLTTVASFLFSMKRRPSGGLAAAGGLSILFGLGILVWLAARPLPSLHVSDFKSLSYLLDFPDAEVLEERHGLRHRATLIRSDAIRIAPGLSLAWTEAIPSQDALVLGADRTIPVPRDPQDPQSIRYLQATLPALAADLITTQSRAVVVGASPMLSALQLREAGIREIEWIEDDPHILRTFEKRLKGEAIRFTRASARRAFAGRAINADLVVLDEAANGGSALNEEMLLTVDFLQSALESTAEQDGYLVMPISLSNPPRYFASIVRTLIQALKTSGVDQPGQHLLALRSMQEGLLVVSTQPIASSKLNRAKEFAARWNFDLVWTSDLSPGETNRYHQLESPLYHEITRALINDQALPDAARWFDTRAADDARPYLWYSMHWSTMPQLLNSMGRHGLVYLDWGVLLMTLAMIVATILAAILILAPLGRLPAHSPPLNRPRVILYFGMLGLGYLLLEMAIFQRCVLLLGEPVVAAAVIFAAFLVGSGVGSWTAPEAARRSRVIRLFGLILLGWLIAALGLGWGGDWLLSIDHPFVAGIGVVAFVLPLAFALGRPFPWGLRRVGIVSRYIPWAWGINGFASVIAPLLAAFVSVQWGQPITWLLGALSYLVAFAVGLSWAQTQSNGTNSKT